MDAVRSVVHHAGVFESVEDKPRVMLGLVNEVDVVSSSWYTDRSLYRESLRQCLQPAPSLHLRGRRVYVSTSSIIVRRLCITTLVSIEYAPVPISEIRRIGIG